MEGFVHLELDPSHLPRNYRLMKAEAEDVRAPKLDLTTLGNNWREDLSLTRSRGDEWLKAGESSLLEVPSAILPETVNFLLNPLHDDAKRIRAIWHERYPYDTRLFKSK